MIEGTKENSTENTQFSFMIMKMILTDQILRGTKMFYVYGTSIPHSSETLRKGIHQRTHKSGQPNKRK